MSSFYDRQGHPVSMEEWMKLYEDTEYRRIALDALPNGGKVSTVWLGLDHGIGERLQTFESMVFAANGVAIDQRRYSTEEEARRGHVEMVSVAAARQGATHG